MTERSWPELGEELARKSLDTLLRAIHDLDEGLISCRDLILIVNTITDCTMGLMPREVSEIIYAVRKELEHNRRIP